MGIWILRISVVHILNLSYLHGYICKIGRRSQPCKSNKSHLNSLIAGQSVVPLWVGGNSASRIPSHMRPVIGNSSWNSLNPVKISSGERPIKIIQHFFLHTIHEQFVSSHIRVCNIGYVDLHTCVRKSSWRVATRACFYTFSAWTEIMESDVIYPDIAYFRSHYPPARLPIAV